MLEQVGLSNDCGMAEEANLLAAFDSGDEHRLLKLWHELVTAAALFS